MLLYYVDLLLRYVDMLLYYVDMLLRYVDMFLYYVDMLLRFIAPRTSFFQSDCLKYIT